jgi:hypothetical protein
MKKSIFTTLLLFPILMFAQQSVPMAPGTYNLFSREALVIHDRDVIWQEDFSDGFTDWQNTEVGGIAAWEYRGPASNPNVEVGSRGSCALPGIGDDPILSPSASNGFVIFDSNWWDNSSNPCSPDYYGTGAGPAPHTATLTSPPIDLSAHPNVALVFNQYLKRFSGEMYVEVSPDGMSWFTVFFNPASPNTTMPDDQQYVQISSFVGGSSQAYIRFVFSGFYYFWQLDDIAIVDTYANDLALRNSTYGDFDLFDPGHPTGFEFMEYSKYPESMPPLLKFSSTCDNVGANGQSNCKLQVDVQTLDGSSVLHSAESAEGIFLFPGASSELRAGTFQMPGTSGAYRVLYEPSQDQVEDFEENNLDTSVFFIDEVQYARDALFTSAVYLGLPEYENIQYEIGNVFLVTAENQSCHSITVAVGLGSSTPANIYGALYSIDISQSIDVTLLGTTQPVAITAEMLNGYADQILTNLVFDNPIDVDAGTAYFVAVGSQEGIDNFVCAMAGNAYEQTSYVRFFPADWFYLDRTPMVRMNFGFFNSNGDEKYDQPEISAYPVPAGNWVNLGVSAFRNENMIVEVIDQGGEIVISEVVSRQTTDVYQMDVSLLSTGIYQFVVRNDQRSASGRFIKQ